MVRCQRPAEEVQRRPRPDEFQDDYRDVANNSAVSVEKEQDRSPLFEVALRPNQAALAVEGQHVVVVEQR